MSGYQCKYHPDREAVAKCEMCGAMVCLECKNVYRRRYHSSYGRYYNYAQYELCPVCYEKRVKQSYNPLCFCFPALFILFFIGVAMSMFSMSSGSGMSPPMPFMAVFFIVPAVMLCLLGYQYFIRGPQIKREATRRKEEALRGSHVSSYTSTASQWQRNYAPMAETKFCPQCGEPLDPHASFCRNCGSKIDK